MEFMTISKLIENLQRYMDEYGDLPILIALSDSDNVLRPALSDGAISISNEFTGQ